MEQITAYLKDPAWWFSAFFAAILASIVAAFAKDYIQSGLGKVSASTRKKIAARTARHETVVEALAGNETFLVATLIRSVALLVLACTCLLLFLLAPMLLDVLTALCQTQGQVNGHACPAHDTTKLRSTLVYAALGSVTIFVNWRSSTVARLAMRGLRSYRIRNDLPAVK